MSRSLPASEVDWRDTWVTDWLWLHTSKKWTTLIADKKTNIKKAIIVVSIVINIVSNCQQLSAIVSIVNNFWYFSSIRCGYYVKILLWKQFLFWGGKSFLSLSRRISLIRLASKKELNIIIDSHDGNNLLSRTQLGVINTPASTWLWSQLLHIIRVRRSVDSRLGGVGASSVGDCSWR